MWLLIPEGFYSIVQKEGEKELCVRARVGADLDRLRETYLPTLGATVETPGSDYRYRAWIDRDDLAEGMAEIVRNLDWANFKDEVARHDASRAHVYGQVWNILGELRPVAPTARETNLRGGPVPVFLFTWLAAFGPTSHAGGRWFDPAAPIDPRSHPETAWLGGSFMSGVPGKVGACTPRCTPA